jgi:hypothetical protein
MPQIFVPYGSHRIGVRGIEWDDGQTSVKRIKITVAQGDDAPPMAISIARKDLVKFIKGGKRTFSALALVDGTAGSKPIVVDEIDGIEYLKFESDGVTRQDHLPTPVA